MTVAQQSLEERDKRRSKQRGKGNTLLIIQSQNLTTAKHTKFIVHSFIEAIGYSQIVVTVHWFGRNKRAP